MKIIRPGVSLLDDFNPENPQLPIDKRIIQYIRQSSLGQVKNNIQSKIQQDEMLERRLLKYGWTHNLIIKIEADQGVSGQKTRFQREGLDQLYRMIETGEAAAIACYDASRLWRDRTHVWYNDFIQVLKRYNIPVVMFNHVYWMNRQADEEGLREEFRQAAFYLKHIYEKVNPAKLQAVESGLSYGGGSVPIGYIVQEEDNRKCFVVYEPHAQRIRYLYKRYRELDGNLPRLGRELVATGFYFPAFEGIKNIPHLSLTFDTEKNGYVIKTRAGLVGLLRNPVYLGWYVYNGVIVSKENHAAIVPYDDFMFAFNRLSKHTLEGEETPQKPEAKRRYQTSTNALLEGLLSGNGVKAYVVGNQYKAKKDNHMLQRTHEGELNIAVKVIDRAFASAFLSVLVGIKQAASVPGEPTAIDALSATINQLSQEKIAQIGSLDEALANVEQGIKEWELAKHVAMKELYEPGVAEAIRNLKRLQADKAMLQKRAKKVGQEQNELAKTQSLIEEAVSSWVKMPFERKQLLVSLIVQSADMVMVSPHILKIEIALKEPVQGHLVGYIYRQYGSSMQWTDAENQLLEKLYASADRADILKALPNRTWVSIVLQAATLGLERHTYKNTSHLTKRVSCQDQRVIDDLQANHSTTLKKGSAFWELKGTIGLAYRDALPEWQRCWYPLISPDMYVVRSRKYHDTVAKHDSQS